VGKSIRELKEWFADGSGYCILKLVEAGKLLLGEPTKKKARRIEPRRHHFETLEPRQMLAGVSDPFHFQSHEIIVGEGSSGQFLVDRADGFSNTEFGVRVKSGGSANEGDDFEVEGLDPGSTGTTLQFSESAGVVPIVFETDDDSNYEGEERFELELYDPETGDV
jgi:hypothetical protein